MTDVVILEEFLVFLIKIGPNCNILWIIFFAFLKIFLFQHVSNRSYDSSMHSTFLVLLMSIFFEFVQMLVISYAFELVSIQVKDLFLEKDIKKELALLCKDMKKELTLLCQSLILPA